MPAPLSAADEMIVRMSLEKLTADNAPRIRQIHQDSLDALRPQLEATQRAVNLREMALAEITRRGF